jgi:hypothetical protein
MIEWVKQHSELAALLGWPLFTLVVTAMFKPRTPEQYMALSAVSPRLAAMLRLIEALGVDGPKVVAASKQLVAKAKKKPEVAK